MVSARPQSAPTTDAPGRAALTQASTRAYDTAHDANVSTAAHQSGGTEEPEQTEETKANREEEGESGTRPDGAPPRAKDGVLIAIAVSAGVILALLGGLAIAYWRARHLPPPSNAAECDPLDTEVGAACTLRDGDDVKSLAPYSSAATSSAVGGVIRP